MITLPRAETEPLWQKYWQEMGKEMLKLEVLQDYSPEDEGPSLLKWLKGDKQESIKLMARDEDPGYTKDCHKKLAEGVDLLRIHIIEEPLTTYIEWEIEFYKQFSIPLRGEKVSLINGRDVRGLRLPKGDMMMFDKRRVVVNHYDINGLMTHETFYDEDDDISHFLKLRQQLLELAKPLKI